MEKTRIFNKKIVRKILLVWIFAFLMFNATNQYNTINVKASGESQTYIYSCNQTNVDAYQGSDDFGAFDEFNYPSGMQFESEDYINIADNDSNFVYDASFEVDEFQYHVFRYEINEDVTDITSIQITWKGYGGNDEESSYRHSLWVREDNQMTQKDTGSGSDIDILTYTYDTGIENVINQGIIFIGVQSDHAAYQQGIQLPGSSFLRSYYIELSVTTEESVEYVEYLDIFHQDSVNEKEEFDVTIKSNGNPVEGVDIVFSGVEYSTNENGIATLAAPEVDSNQSVDIFVTKNGYYDNQSSIQVLNIPVSITPILDISCQENVNEEEEFDVTITSDGNPVDDVSVNFNSITLPTDIAGVVTFTAPPVLDDSIFMIKAEKQGYTSDQQIITVLNISQNGEINNDTNGDNNNDTNGDNITVENGWIYGYIIDLDALQPIENALVCAILNDEESSLCSYSDEIGYYNLTLSPGLYTIEATKNGYSKDSETVEIQAGIESFISLYLEKKTTVAKVDNAYIEHTISKKASENKLGARLEVDKESNILYYNDQLDIEFLDETDKISFTIEADEGTPGTVIAIKINENALEDLENIDVTFDGEKLEEVYDIESFFEISEDDKPCWISVQTKQDLYVFVKVSHFSKHTIQISSSAEIINWIGIMLNYFMISVIFIVLLVVPIFVIGRKKYKA